MARGEITIVYHINDRISWFAGNKKPKTGTIVAITESIAVTLLDIRIDGVEELEHLPLPQVLEQGGRVTPEAIHHPGSERTGHPVSECASRGCNFPKPKWRNKK